MRLVTYADERGGWRAGVTVGSLLVDAAQAARKGGLRNDEDEGGWASVRQILAQPADQRLALLDVANQQAAGGRALAADELKLGPPVPDPELGAEEAPVRLAAKRQQWTASER
jgi:hypothetical protein